MSTTATPATEIPTGTWTSDRVHSTFTFSVRHMVVATYRGGFDDFDVTLETGDDGQAVLTGAARVASANTQDPNLDAHLQSPDFFDAERHPEVRFRSTEIVRDGDAIRIAGDLTLKGRTGRIELAGEISGPVAGLGDAERIGLELTGRLDRTEYGLDWNAPLPKGGFALANEVKLQVNLELARA
jgi:polyisoprenoid-binding protein YceI